MDPRCGPPLGARGRSGGPAECVNVAGAETGNGDELGRLGSSSRSEYHCVFFFGGRVFSCDCIRSRRATSLRAELCR